ncbi:protocadherin alpha-5 isoform X2 [Alligator mississippiensis]|uniref:protocadherin alpha-5 isoform X2 n=1 Tax=Alligator mississippiensis TaxID=8496 RepID=UPI002877D800|nr:protocadherin alpha-5 isoform X2 [Alligator mississippiensis]
MDNAINCRIKGHIGRTVQLLNSIYMLRHRVSLLSTKKSLWAGKSQLLPDSELTVQSECRGGWRNSPGGPGRRRPGLRPARGDLCKYSRVSPATQEPFGVTPPGSAMSAPRLGGPAGRQLLRLVLLQAAWAAGSGPLQYSVPEEAKAGTLVGRLAQDLGLEAGELAARRLRLVWKGGRDSLEVKAESGALVVQSRLDREELCGQSARCALHLEVLVDKPLRVFHVEVEIQDINDNAPVFPRGKQSLSIAESLTLPGTRFPLEVASDADIGINALLSYKLSLSEYFSLDVQNKNEKRQSAELVLSKSLDREETPVHHLLLTATDGGKPELTGTVQLVITVLDVNDNAPVFSQAVYEVSLPEDAANGTLVINLNATDLDEGINAEVLYSFSSLVGSRVKEKFSIDSRSGEIKVKGALDFEDMNLYEIHVQAADQGHLPLSGHCRVVVALVDVNDNAPELWVTPLSVPVAEDAAPGTVVALIRARDRDSGANGAVTLWLRPEAPFRLVSSFRDSYSLVLAEALDRERVAAYEVEVRARDAGAPALGASSRLAVPVADVNDNAPAFAQAVYTAFVRENNAPGAAVLTVRARDADAGENGAVSYSVAGGGAQGRPASSLVAVEAASGRVRALQPLDYEEVQVVEFEVRAQDAGSPALWGRATVQLFVLDANDNAPAVWAPAAGAAPLLVPQSAGAGQVVAKVRAVDADSGYNAWLRYELQEPRGAGPFRVGLYSGEVRTARPLDEADGPRHSLVVLVRDHGEPALCATATLSVSLVDSAQASAAAAGAARAAAAAGAAAAAAAAAGPDGPLSELNAYLILAICAVCGLLVLALGLAAALRWRPRAAVLCGPGQAALVCASEVGSWSYSQRHSRQLGGGEAAGKADLMVFSPGCPPVAADVKTRAELQPNVCGTPKQPNPDWRYSASLRAGMQSAVHMEEAGVLRGGPGGPEQQWPTVSSATPEPEAGEVSPPVGAGVNSNSWTFKFGPGNPKQGGPESKKQTQVSFLLRRKGDSSQYSQ